MLLNHWGTKSRRHVIDPNSNLLSYSEFLSKYCIPVTPRDFVIVMDAILMKLAFCPVPLVEMKK